ncbi:Transgelin [Paragonimus heterotremus]|uniref:Transgelin n=1 Tax=Paragonimus heterotremus TaxID=100268 RepID=A0A8J4SY42_9TREM|nr:Transgelin [Paragonimus heterotremus]
MSSLRADKVGFAKQAQDRMNEKYDSVVAAKVLRWIRWFKTPTGLHGPTVAAASRIPQEVQSIDIDAFASLLSDGLALGYLMACLEPGMVQKLLNSKTWQVSDRPAFETSRQRERIGMFLQFLAEFGMNSSAQFQTDQLYERTGVAQVVNALSQLGIEAQTRPGYAGPPGFWLCRH